VLIAYPRNYIPIRLTAERWEHVAARHPEMASQRDRLLNGIDPAR